MLLNEQHLLNNIFNIKDESNFEKVALEVFKFQYNHLEIYKKYCSLLSITPEKVRQITDIPHLPITCFKHHHINSQTSEETIFTSSGTGNNGQSKHPVYRLSVYNESFKKGFEHFYGNSSQFQVIGLLPAYMERKGSSLIHMVNDFIKNANYPNSTISLELNNAQISDLENPNIPSLLIGVSFALLDLAEKGPFHFKNTIVMETGGMKGRRKEIVREELHEILQKSFQVENIHSEYGMTELLSQAYLKRFPYFECPPWMKVWTRSTDDPLGKPIYNKTGGINIIDLANLYSCSFISTQDLGKVSKNGQFEVLGRFDHAEIRGCNLMVE